MTRLLPNIARVVLTLLLVLLAIVAIVIVWQHYQDDPWTRDGVVQADVAQVAPDASGLVTQIRIHDNQLVRVGDVLFTVDHERYAAQLQQKKAEVASSQASVVSARADVFKSRVTLANAVREEKRYLSLGNLVSQEDRDMRITTVDQDRAQLASSEAKVGEEQASLKESLADLRVAQVNLERSAVRAGVDGYVTGFTMRPGDYVDSGSSQFALVDIRSFYVLGYFEETKLHRFNLGDRARINLLGDSRPLWGHVDSLAAGITDRQRDPSEKMLPNITPTFSWIRLAQRVPVRVVIDRIPVGIRLVAGRTASITILPTARLIAPSPRPSSGFIPNTAPLHRPAPPPVGQPATNSAL